MGIVMTLDQFAAVAACVILAGLAAFQGALVGGAPWGRLAWGGQHEVLPSGLKIGSALSIVLYAVFGYAAAAKAGLVLPLVNMSVTSVAVWVLTVYFAVGVIMNGVSRSKPERLVMTPTAVVLTALYLVLAIG